MSSRKKQNKNRNKNTAPQRWYPVSPFENKKNAEGNFDLDGTVIRFNPAIVEPTAKRTPPEQFIRIAQRLDHFSRFFTFHRFLDESRDDKEIVKELAEIYKDDVDDLIAIMRGEEFRSRAETETAYWNAFLILSELPEDSLTEEQLIQCIPMWTYNSHRLTMENEDTDTPLYLVRFFEKHPKSFEHLLALALEYPSPNLVASIIEACEAVVFRRNSEDKTEENDVEDKIADLPETVTIVGSPEKVLMYAKVVTTLISIAPLFMDPTDPGETYYTILSLCSSLAYIKYEPAIPIIRNIVRVIPYKEMNETRIIFEEKNWSWFCYAYGLPLSKDDPLVEWCSHCDRPLFICEGEARGALKPRGHRQLRKGKELLNAGDVIGGVTQLLCGLFGGAMHGFLLLKFRRHSNNRFDPYVVALIDALVNSGHRPYAEDLIYYTDLGIETMDLPGMSDTNCRYPLVQIPEPTFKAANLDWNSKRRTATDELVLTRFASYECDVSYHDAAVAIDGKLQVIRAGNVLMEYDDCDDGSVSINEKYLAYSSTNGKCFTVVDRLTRIPRKVLSMKQTAPIDLLLHESYIIVTYAGHRMVFDLATLDRDTARILPGITPGAMGCCGDSIFIVTGETLQEFSLKTGRFLGGFITGRILGHQNVLSSPTRQLDMRPRTVYANEGFVVIGVSYEMNDLELWQTVTYSRASRCAITIYHYVRPLGIIPNSKFFVGSTDRSVILYNIPDQRTAQLFPHPYANAMNKPELTLVPPSFFPMSLYETDSDLVMAFFGLGAWATVTVPKKPGTPRIFSAPTPSMSNKVDRVSEALKRGDPQEKKVCWSCGFISDKKLQTCGQCRVARYCSVTCQRADWKAHKIKCGTETKSGSEFRK